MPGNYDPVASFYDPLSRLVFGNAIQKAQSFLLGAIPANSRILIIGGGTGWILKEITRLQPGGLSITYIEISQKMIFKAKERPMGHNHIHFLHDAIQEAQLEGSYDVVITPFLLDNFTVGTLNKVFQKIDPHLKTKGYWLFSDFQVFNNRADHQMMLKLMYLFFHYLCKLETTRLHNPSSLFKQWGYIPIKEKTFYRDFICSIIYQKKEKGKHMVV